MREVHPWYTNHLQAVGRTKEDGSERRKKEKGGKSEKEKEK